MAKKDKVLEILALAQLPEHAKIANLAHRWVGKAFSREQATAVIKCYLDANGRTPLLIQAIIDEKLRQERIRNDRKAVADAAVKWAESPMLKYRNNPRLKQKRAMELAKATFGQHVKDNFNENALALMSLIAGENRSYTIKWMAAGFQPVRCALIEVVTRGKVNSCQTNIIHSRFLLYRAHKQVLVARTGERDIQAAWASQLPQELVAKAAGMKAEGYQFKNDLFDQELIVFRPDGTQYLVPWAGRTVN